jgi:hypothetical protein
MFSIFTMFGKELITFQNYALVDDEWIEIQELIERENDLMWYFDNYIKYVSENPDPRIWGLSL